MCKKFAKCIQGEFKMSRWVNSTYSLDYKSSEGTFINQAKYTKELLKRFGMMGAKPLATPMSTSIKFDKDKNSKKCG